ncbi:hypothetical protein SELMODRAFT_411155 [Selaginella moellendorffii]|uniref:Uncharacterized protein n=1 Tax=Selaginella moellendorffii TaxID=88036 RepID=D8RGR2_SELML|nr:hypothetical protein SELMODRAFT_411155 [Selaginella moellendorffii]
MEKKAKQTLPEKAVAFDSNGNYYYYPTWEDIAKRTPGDSLQTVRARFEDGYFRMVVKPTFTMRDARAGISPRIAGVVKFAKALQDFPGEDLHGWIDPDVNAVLFKGVKRGVLNEERGRGICRDVLGREVVKDAKGEIVLRRNPRRKRKEHIKAY